MRQTFPESSLWESREGYQWLVRLVYATLYCFGIKQGIGSERFHCRWMVSDGAKALTKLALDGLGCRWVPDLFHAMWNLGKPIDRLLLSFGAKNV